MFKPSRLTTYIALFGGFMLAATLVYRRVRGDDSIALCLGIATVVALLAAGLLSTRQQRIAYREPLISQPEFRARTAHGRVVAQVGTAVLAISFVLLIIGFMAFAGSKYADTILVVWAILFGVGLLLRFYQRLVRFGIMLHLIAEDREKP